MKKLLIALVLVFLPSMVECAVSVSTIAVASNTVTVVTGSAHGLTVNTGFCLSAPANVCAVAKTITNATTFTFDQPTTGTVAACAASCGTGDVAPQVIILPTSVSGPRQTIRYLRWVTTLAPIPSPGATSAWVAVSGLSAGASDAQKSALAAGSFIEQADTMSLPANLAAATLQAIFQADYLLFQSALSGGAQPGTYYGFTWNATGNSWVRQ